MGATQSIDGGSKPRFPLPAELRIRVWRDTVQPRVIGLVVCKHRGHWTLKSDIRSPVSLAICRESRLAVQQHYKLLEFKSGGIDDMGNRDPLDIPPYILVNFHLDTIAFGRRHPKIGGPALTDAHHSKSPGKILSARDLCTMREQEHDFGPGFRRVLNMVERIQHWPEFVFGGCGAVGTNLPQHIALNGDWSSVQRLRVDLGDYLNNNLYARNLPGGNLWPFMSTMAEQIERRYVALKVVDLVLPSRPGGKQMRLFRMTTRHQQVPGDGRELSEILQLDGAIISADWMCDTQSSISFFEVVSSPIDKQVLRKMGEFSREKLINIDRSQARLEKDIQAFWAGEKTFGQGQLVPVQGLCFSWYDGR